MEKCKFCQEELAEDSTVCPHCGKDNAQPETEEKAPAAEVKEEKPAEKSEETAAEKPEEKAEEKVEDKAEEKSEEKTEDKTEEKSEEKVEEKPAEEEKKPEQKKATPAQMAVGIAIIVVLAAILVALIVSALGQKKPEPTETTAVPETTQAAATEAPKETVPAETVPATIPPDGNPEDATCKGSYTADPEAAKAAAKEVVASVGEFKLTNAELQIYYWKGIQSLLQANPYVGYMVDLTKPLDVQPCPVAEGMTWQQFFLTNALASWQNYQSMAAEADANKLPQNQDDVKFVNELPSQIEKEAKDLGYANGAELLAADVGPITSIQDYVKFVKTFHRGYYFYEYFLSVAQPDDAALEQYYDSHKDLLEEGGITKDTKSVNVRHILVKPTEVEKDESWKEAEKKAQDLLKQFESGDKTEDSFAALATEHTEDPGSQQTGGLYTDVAQGQMVPEFDKWCFEDGRKVGDTGIVETEYGYHIMFYAGDQLTWKTQVTNMYLNDKTDELMKKNLATYPLHVEYDKIVLVNPVEKPAEK